MAGARQSADSSRERAAAALEDGRKRSGGDRSRAAGPSGPAALLALQRAAGNSAVSALMAARLRSPGAAAVSEIDAALRQLKQDEPALDVVETGLRTAKAAGVPVDLEGQRPPASALAVSPTGFGPAQVPAKKAVPAAKPVPAKSALGKAAAKAAPAKKAAAPAPAAKAGPAAATAAPAGGAAPVEAAPLSGAALLAPPVKPTGVQPGEDPAFRAVTGKVGGFAADKRAHPPAAAKAAEAQAAAVPPTEDVAGQAKASKVDAMDAQQAGAFDKKAFIAAVKTAIEAKSPKTLTEAADPASGKAGEVKGEVKGLVTSGKDGQAKDIETATEAPPDPSTAVAKPVTPMAPEQPGALAQVPAAGAAPKPAPPEQLNLAAGKQQADDELNNADVPPASDGKSVTDATLAGSNEPAFQGAVADKQAAAAHADTAPGQYRAAEADTLAQQKAQASAETAEGVAGMQGSKAAALAQVVAGKGAAKSKDEAKRAEVTAKIGAIYAAAEADVKKILDAIDPKVEAAFDTGEKSARAAFESFVGAKMAAYKKDRYGGWLGGLRWAKDKLLGMPSKVNEFYTAGRELYLQQMDGVISRVADIVATDLTAAKARIATGKGEIQAYVKTLPSDLAKVGSEASAEIGEKFTALEGEVNSKQDALVETLASKYVEARSGLDARIEELQAENAGLVDKAIGAIKAVIGTIRELVSMLTGVLARAAGVIGDIIKNPVGFLGNLIAGVKGGILRFKDNILTHLKKGLFGWLFGALAEGGVEMPETFDVKGIIKLLASLFGLTWNNIRNRLVKQIGEKAMGAAEKGVEIFQLLAGGGVAALWQMLMEKLGDIKEMILEQVKDFVITKIITAGITWLIGLLNPAAAFIKACKLIYDVIMFFVTNGSRIMAFVNTVIDSVTDIVKGNVSGVVEKIENVLGQMVPIIIGFLASVIGLGGIGQKIRQIVETLQKPINKALDFVIKQGLKLAGPLIRGLSNLGSRAKAKAKAGIAWAKGKAEAGKNWAKNRLGGSGAEKGRKEAAIRDANAVLAKRPSHRDADASIHALVRRHNVPLRLVVESKTAKSERVHVQAMSSDSHDLPGGGEELTEPLKAALATLTTDDAKKQFDIMRRKSPDMARFEKAIAAKTAAASRMNPAKTLDDILAAEYGAKAAATPPSAELVAAIDAALAEITRVETRARTYATAHPGVRGTQRWLTRLKDERGPLEKEKTGASPTTSERIGQHAKAVRGIDAEIELAERSRDVSEVSMPVSGNGAKSDVDVVTDGGRTWKDAKDYELFGLGSYNWTHHLRPQAVRQLDIAGDPAYSKSGTPKLVYWFRRGVTVEVADALEELGIGVEGNRVAPPSGTAPKGGAGEGTEGADG